MAGKCWGLAVGDCPELRRAVFVRHEPVFCATSGAVLAAFWKAFAKIGTGPHKVGILKKKTPILQN
ncbi:hypothetical protein JCM16814_31710 [Desulfobaculum senezii]